MYMNHAETAYFVSRATFRFTILQYVYTFVIGTALVQSCVRVSSLNYVKLEFGEQVPNCSQKKPFRSYLIESKKLLRRPVKF